jgi:hypothetical protein
LRLDTKCTSEVQELAQEQLHRLLKASADLDKLDALAASKSLDAHHQQQAIDARAAVMRSIEILTGANTDEECAEALRVVGGCQKQCVRRFL